MMYEMYLMHHGIKGQKWGVKHGPPYPLEQHSAGKFSGAKDPKALSSWMKKNISYTDYTTLKSPSETVKRGKGSCHDQVLLELEELRSMGYNPKATFFLEYTPKSSQSGTTHSFVTYEQNGKTYWFENSWGGQEGLHEFNNFDEVKKQITKLHKEGKTGDSSRFPNLEFSDFGEHKPGESLQELVDKALATEDEEDEKVKHSEEGDDFKMTNNFIELSEVLASFDPNYLEHHGIKGQNWGVKRGPPYPLQSGIRTRIKKITQAAKNRVAANRKQREARRTERRERKVERKESLQQRISKMSDAELIERTNRLRLENAYKRELPHEESGRSFLRKNADRLNALRSFGDAFSGLIESGKRMGHVLGLDRPQGDEEGFERRSGESLKDYTTRMAQLASLKKSRDSLGVGSKSSNPDDDSDGSSKKSKSSSSAPTSTARTEYSSDSSSGKFKKAKTKKDDDYSPAEEKTWDSPTSYQSEVSSWYRGGSSKEFTQSDVSSWYSQNNVRSTAVQDLPDSYATSGRNFFKESFPQKVADSSWSDWTKEDPDKKKKG